MRELTPAEAFVAQMGWSSRPSGEEHLVIEVCPFCLDNRYKFYMHVGGEKDGVYDCKICGKSGNLHTLRNHLGVSVDNVASIHDVANAKAKKAPLPDFDALNWRLLNDTQMGDVLDYLVADRKFSIEAIKQLKIGAESFDDKKWFVIPYFNRSGQAVYYKARTIPPYAKAFRSPAGREAPLFNENVILPGMDELVIVEGEADAISLISQGYQTVVGVPGAGVHKAAWIERLLNFNPKKLYLMYDNDRPGQAGAHEMAVRIGLDKPLNIILPEFMVDEGKPGKDINDWFMAGKTLEEFQALKAAAKPFDVKGIQDLQTVLDELKADIEGRGTEPTYTTPWPSLTKRLGGMEPGDVIGIMAPGKCFTEDTYVNTSDGLYTINELLDTHNIQGDAEVREISCAITLTNRHGELEDTAAITVNGAQQVLEVVTQSGHRVKVTADQEFLVIDDGTLVWKKASDLTTDDYIANKRTYHFGTGTMPHDEAYALGVLIADGSFEKYRIRIVNNDPHIKKVIETTLSRMIGVSPKVYQRNGDGVSYEFNSIECATRFYQTYGLGVSYASTKEFSRFMRGMDKPTLRSMLQGYMDCEAAFLRKARNIEVSSASYNLLLQLKLILRGFDVEARIRQKLVKGYNEPYYALVIAGQNVQRYRDSVGTSSPARETTLRGIQVSDKDHSNVDVIPHCKGILRRLYKTALFSKTRKTCAALARVMCPKSKQRLTYQMLDWVVSQSWGSAEFSKLQYLHEQHYFFDRVKSVALAGVHRTYDFKLPETHSFIANGMVAHNCGKTTVALNWLHYHSACDGIPTLMFCLEMPPKRMVRKWVSLVTQTDDTPGASQITSETVNKAIEIGSKMPGDILFGFTRANKPDDVFETIRQAVRRYGVKIVCFDNLQLLSRSVEHAAQETSKLSKQFKELAMELGIVILLIVQPNRVAENEFTSARNAMNSSAIEKDVDAMICLDRKRVAKLKQSDVQGFIETDENFEPTMYVRVDLSRYAPGGLTTLEMDGARSTVREYGEQTETAQGSGVEETI